MPPERMNVEPHIGSLESGFRSERGAALVMALMTVALMSLLGLVMLDVLHNSRSQAAASEASIQAGMLAQEGLDEALALVRNAVDRANRDAFHPLPRDKAGALQTELDRIAARLGEPQYSQRLPASRGTYAIDARWSGNFAALDTLPAATPDYPYVGKLTVVSTGTIPGHGPGRIVRKRMELYVSTINPVFRYPVSSSGDLTLNGFPYIVGNVLAKGGLIYSDEARFIGKPGSGYGKSTQLPAVKGFIKVDPGRGYTNRLTGRQGSWSPAYFSREAFPFEDSSLAADRSIDVAGYFAGLSERIDAIASDSRYVRVTGGGGLGGTELGQGTAFGSGLATGTKVLNEWTSIAGDLTVEGDLAIVDGVLAVGSTADPQPVVRLNDGSLYVRFGDADLVAADLTGTFVIAADRRIVVEGNAVLGGGFVLRGNGTMFVRGDLKVVGDIDVDGTIYVDGNVDLRGMRSINATSERPLVLAASGSFDFSDNRLNGATRTVRAFLYSERDMNLYGVLSRIKIHGGIHGRNVALNAVGGIEGEASDTTYNGDQGEKFGFTPGQLSLQPGHSLLQVFYDEMLYEHVMQSYETAGAASPIRIPTTDKLDIYVKNVAFDAD